MARAKELISHYPDGRQQSAVMGLLDLAQRQVGRGHEYAGLAAGPGDRICRQPARYAVHARLRSRDLLHHVHMAPVGRFHVQVCGTTPCMLRGSDDILDACYRRGMHKGATTGDGLFTLTEVECMGNCSSAPMVQINDDNYEDLTPSGSISSSTSSPPAASPRSARRSRGATPSSRWASDQSRRDGHGKSRLSGQW